MGKIHKISEATNENLRDADEIELNRFNQGKAYF